MPDFFSFFIPDENSFSFDILMKSKTLVVFSAILVLFLPVIWILLLLLLRHSLFSLLSLFFLILIVSIITSLLVLRRGYYHAASNIFVFASLFGYSLYLLSGSFKFNEGVIVSGYNLYIFILFSTLFCTRRTTLITALAALSIQTFSLFSNNGLSRDIKIMSQINFTFELIIIASISYLIISITEKTLVRLIEEADNRKNLERTRTLLESVTRISSKLADSSSVMSNTTETFSSNAQNQAAFAEEITATVEEISAGVESISDTAVFQMNKISALVTKLDELSTQIGEMKNMISAALDTTLTISAEVKDGETSLAEMNENMNSMNLRTGEMTNIISIINDISDRINLLSLNAAIEAARAGDAGRGFAVVADEISKLADQTSSSVKEISKLLAAGDEEMKHGMSTVKTVVNTLSKIISGVGQVNEMILTMSEYMSSQLATNRVVNDEASDVRNRSDEIQTAALEQKNATNEIVKSISAITELTQANASGAEEMSANARAISEIAFKLNREVDEFGSGE